VLELISPTGPAALGAAEDRVTRGFEARRRAATAAIFASLGGAAEGEAVLEACDGVAGERAERGASLEDARDVSTS
jgi:hypothetical protein